MILTRGLGYGGGIAARGFGAWIGGVVPPAVLPVPTAASGGGGFPAARQVARRDRRVRDEELIILFRSGK
jgi:hypothetical protein